MKKIPFLTIILVFLISSSVQAFEWSYSFVVLDGKEYEVKICKSFKDKLLGLMFKKDKIDKTPEESGESINHSIFTKELIKRNYISKDDSSSFLFDQFFEELLEQGNNFRDLLIMTNYVVSRIKERDFKDEDGNEIRNKYGYFKNALIGNIRRFENLEHLYEFDDDEEYDWLNDNEEDYEL